jgi:radical SAM superfamily enzyme YgiQ (UPF0313 family)
MMYESGCRQVFIGFESLNQENLDAVNKGRVNKAEHFSKCIQKIQSHKIMVFGSFIVGFDQDDESIMEKTVKFIRENDIAFSSIAILTPLPGTRLYRRLENEGRIIVRNWGRYNMDIVCFRPMNMSVDTLQNGFYWAMQELYSYDSIYERLIKLWSQGILVGREKRHSILDKLSLFINTFSVKDPKKTLFVIKVLCNKYRVSIASVLYALSFHGYAYGFPRVGKCFSPFAAINRGTR